LVELSFDGHSIVEDLVYGVFKLIELSFDGHSMVIQWLFGNWVLSFGTWDLEFEALGFKSYLPTWFPILF
jgi:hypothetical protein